jgi:DNA polymerase phi
MSCSFFILPIHAKNRPGARKNRLHFRFKILDLLEVFVKKQPSNALILELTLPLIRLARSLAGSIGNNDSDSRQLLEKVQALISKRVCGVDPSGLAGASARVRELLQQTLDLAAKGGNESFGVLCARASCFFARILASKKAEVTPEAPKKGKRKSSIKADKPVEEDDHAFALRLYREAMERFLTKKHSGIRPSLFLELAERFPSFAWGLTPTALSGLQKGGSAKPFLRAQACHFVTGLVKKVPKEVSLIRLRMHVTHSYFFADIS